MNAQDKNMKGTEALNNTDTTTIYTPEKVAEILGVKESFVKRQIREGNLKGFKVGSKFWRISKASLDEYCQTCSSNEDNNGHVREETKNKIQFHAALRSQDAIPGSLEAMEQSINNIKAQMNNAEGYKKVAMIAKLKSAVDEREEKKQRLNGIADELKARVEKAYPDLIALVDQDPNALEAYFAQGEDAQEDEKPAAEKGHAAKRLMVAGKV